MAASKLSQAPTQRTASGQSFSFVDRRSLDGSAPKTGRSRAARGSNLHLRRPCQLSCQGDLVEASVTSPTTISTALAPPKLGRHRSLASRYRDGGCGSAGDVTLASGAGQSVLAEAAGRLAAAIEAGDDLGVHVDDLAGGIDAQAGAGVVDDRGCPGRMEGWTLDPMPWARLVEIRIDSAFDKEIVSCHGLFEIGRRHRHALVLHDDLLGEIGEPVGAEEEAGSDVDVRRSMLDQPFYRVNSRT